MRRDEVIFEGHSFTFQTEAPKPVVARFRKLGAKARKDAVIGPGEVVTLLCDDPALAWRLAAYLKHFRLAEKRVKALAGEVSQILDLHQEMKPGHRLYRAWLRDSFVCLVLAFDEHEAKALVHEALVAQGYGKSVARHLRIESALLPLIQL